MSYRVLAAEDAFWRPSNQMGVPVSYTHLTLPTN